MLSNNGLHGYNSNAKWRILSSLSNSTLVLWLIVIIIYFTTYSSVHVIFLLVPNCIWFSAIITKCTNCLFLMHARPSSTLTHRPYYTLTTKPSSTLTPRPSSTLTPRPSTTLAPRPHSTMASLLARMHGLPYPTSLIV